MVERSVCPRCGNTDIGLDTVNFKSLGLGGSSMYKCRNCGLTSPVFPVMDETTAKDFQTQKLEPLNEELNENSDNGKGLWIIFAVGIIMLVIWPLLGVGFLLFAIALSFRKKKNKSSFN
jgi:hypothetical protein